MLNFDRFPLQTLVHLSDRWQGTIKPNDVERYNVSDGTLKFNVVVRALPLLSCLSPNRCFFFASQLI